jgi:hypothetical protein
VAQVVGFKYQNYQEQIAAAKVADKTANIDTLLPKGLFLLTAILLKNSIIKFEDIWPHLSNFNSNSGELDELESLINKQIKLVQFHYK